VAGRGSVKVFRYGYEVWGMEFSGMGVRLANSVCITTEAERQGVTRGQYKNRKTYFSAPRCPRGFTASYLLCNFFFPWEYLIDRFCIKCDTGILKFYHSYPIPINPIPHTCYRFALSYCKGQATSWPSSFAARKGK